MNVLLKLLTTLEDEVMPDICELELELFASFLSRKSIISCRQDNTVFERRHMQEVSQR